MILSLSLSLSRTLTLSLFPPPSLPSQYLCSTTRKEPEAKKVPFEHAIYTFLIHTLFTMPLPQHIHTQTHTHTHAHTQPHAYHASKDKPSAVLPPFTDVSSLELSDSVPKEKLHTFMVMYRAHCQRMLDSIVSATFDEVGGSYHLVLVLMYLSVLASSPCPFFLAFQLF